MDYNKNLDLLKDALSGNEKAISRLMENNLGLVRSIAMKFLNRGVEYDDLVQIGSIGMFKAIKSFDLSKGTAFSTYAVPLIIGEIRRFIRDDGLIKVSRIYKQQGARLMREREKYINDNGCEPKIEVLAKKCNLTVEEAAVAIDASSPVNSLSASLVGEDENFSLENILSDDKDEIDKRVEHIALAQAISSLPPLWRKIIILRYLNDFSQQKTANKLGLTQVKISREEKKIFEVLRKELS